MGDVAGIGPEVLARVATTEEVRAIAHLLMIGNPLVLHRSLQLIGRSDRVTVLESIADWDVATGDVSLCCWNPSEAPAADVLPGRVDPAAGQAAYDWLIAAADAALNEQLDAIVTAPLNKAALHAAGHHDPGHTEILARCCGVEDFAMMLYLPAGDLVRGTYGLGVAHVTLHTSIASVPGLLTTGGIQGKIGLVHRFLTRLGCRSPRIGVCALNPHAGEEGIFGDEERRIIAPAVNAAQESGIDVFGPFPADTLLHRAANGLFDGIVAMYHDQGHIALKLIGFQRAVNVTLGLPIVRTSPSHGTAFDIAWQGTANDAGMREAIRVAVELAQSHNPAAD